MKVNPDNPSFLLKVLFAGAMLLFSVRVVAFFSNNAVTYFSGRYSDDYYNFLENLFNKSQYRQKDNPVFIPDETVFSYASGAYLRGTDPILINSEHTPLSKYIIGLGILLWKSDTVFVPVFAFLFLFSVWLVSREVFGPGIVSLIPVLLFGSEVLFLNQLVVAPLLDLFHVPFLLLSVWAYIRELRTNRLFILTGIFLGLTAATKTVVPVFLFIAVVVAHMCMIGKAKRIIYFILSLPIAVVIFSVSYAKTFLDGYSIGEFLKFQKWIFLYQKSKLIYPLTFWELIYLNRWQAWWGDRSVLHASDWQLTWPLIITGTLLSGVFLKIRKKSYDPSILFLFMYALSWIAFLSLGVVSSRFFLPLFPVCYILTVWIIRSNIYGKKGSPKT